MVNKKVLLVFLALVLSGCISPQTYVAPGFTNVTYDSLNLPATKVPVVVDVEFKRNGQPHQAADPELRKHVEDTLLTSGVFTLVSGNTDNNRLKVMVNNIGDIDDARAKGFKTGLTLGATGSLVVDVYEFKIEFTDGSGSGLREEYRQELHTTLGNISPPFDNTQPTTPARGFAIIVEQAILKFISAMQRGGHFGLFTFEKSLLAAPTMCYINEKRA